MNLAEKLSINRVNEKKEQKLPLGSENVEKSERECSLVARLVGGLERKSERSPSSCSESVGLDNCLNSLS
jgi:hypothetical protein